VDVSAKTLMAKLWRDDQQQTAEFTNDPAGHRAMVKWVGRRGRACMEATGVYHLQLALALRKAGVEVMVLNPRVAKAFAGALSRRSKTDKVDSGTLLEYVQRMEFVAWVPPSEAVMELRELGRRLGELTQQLVDEKNRLHAKNAAAISPSVIADVKAHIRQISAHIKKIEKDAVGVMMGEDDLREQYQILLGARGIGRRSAILLLTELAVLDREMTVRQLVAYAGLDPRVYESGTSVEKPARISKIGNARIRAILFMVALSAIRHDRGPRLFFARLVQRGKKKMQAVVAVMRKLLHGIWVVLQRRVAWDSSNLFAASLAQAESSDSAVAANQPQPGQDHPKGRSEAEELRQQLEPAPAEATAQRGTRSRAALAPAQSPQQRRPKPRSNTAKLRQQLDPMLAVEVNV
jgi:transposase